MLDMTLANLQDDWQFEKFRAKREREIAEQGIRAAIEYENMLEKRRDIRSNIVTTIFGITYVTFIIAMILDALLK